MKGLLLKDFYITRSILAILAIVFIVIGASLSYLVNPWVLTVLATVMLGMNVTATINMDKSSGWLKTVITTPVNRKTFINSKYLMYLLLSVIGLVFGVSFGLIACLILGQSTEMIGLFICISLTMALLSGSVILPCYFIFDESKSVLGTILSYPISAGIFVSLILSLGKTTTTFIIIVFIAVCLFAISWYLSAKILAQKDI
ncbi:MAG: ABC-2 transporter permease [Erysipelotrichales bacterium]|nr:ABC-2 transporter permease [Erysipelotrichales bacterium]